MGRETGWEYWMYPANYQSLSDNKLSDNKLTTAKLSNNQAEGDLA
jgi:hypothetical protein